MRRKNRFPKTFIWALFLRVHTIFPRQKRIWSTFCEKFATFRKFAFWGEKCDFFQKNQLFWCQEFHFRPDRSKPYETNAFLGVLGSIFLHFALFTKFHFFRAKTVFGAQNHFFAKRCAFLRFGVTFWTIPAPLRKLLRNLSFLWCFGPPFPLFSILGAKFAFFRARSDFSAKK